MVHSGAFGSYPIKTPTRAPFKLFFVQLYIKYVLRVLLLWLIFFKNSTHVIYRGEGKNTVAIALRQADPVVETVDCSSPCGSTPILYLFSTNFKHLAIPQYNFFMGLYLLFCGEMVITFRRRSVIPFIITSTGNVPLDRK